jgi:ERCC4-type nuclease
MSEPLCMIIVDTRERLTGNVSLVEDLVKKYTWKPGELSVSQLGLFDIVFEQNGINRACYERKTAADFVASMKDGRLDEQLARIIDYTKEHQDVVVGFILEGDLEKVDCGKIPIQHVKHTLWGLNVYNISVVYTKSADETCQFLVSMRSMFAKTLTLEEAQMSAVDNRKVFRGKKRSVTEKEMLYQTLRIIGGLNAKQAMAVSTKYLSVINLSSLLSKNPILLHGFSAPGSRKIGETLGRKIYRLFSGPITN